MLVDLSKCLSKILPLLSFLGSLLLGCFLATFDDVFKDFLELGLIVVLASKKLCKEGTELVKLELLLVGIHRAKEQSLRLLVLLLQEECFELLLIDISTAIRIHKFEDLNQFFVKTWAQGKHVTFRCISAVRGYVLPSCVDFTPRAGHTAGRLFDSCRGSDCREWLRIDMLYLR